ncbi:GNAT family N-acetyltransferase [Mesobacillus zeae]|uniref:N-acetyltransferase n=1 Tax=Mesobacillus zeae TaxID=1917180 RepID=A0A398AXG4_9BACI|nr:GNAT family N-acetyltransferase [Mesobacillus zeae]RID82251.1 N-acetyltransferase [Mesobacillus zeae]
MNPVKKPFRISFEKLSPEDYVSIRLEAGLSAKSVEAAAIGLKNSIHSVSVYQDAVLIGFGRIIGDGALFYQIVDIAVKPAWQGKGIGKEIMQQLMDYLERNTLPGAYVSLIADNPANRLYEKFGFKYTMPQSHGMYKKY